MRSGLDLSLRIVEEYSDRELAIPIMGSALEEPEAASRTLQFLMEAPESRAPREILRRLHGLDEALRRRAVERCEKRLLTAARQLLRSDRPQTRQNIVLLSHAVVERSPHQRAAVFSLLLVLIDDPREQVRNPARRVFLDQLGGGRATELRLGPRDPILNALGILLGCHSEHRDDAVIRVLLSLGEYGADLLGRAVGEDWPVAEDIVRVVRTTGVDPEDLDHSTLHVWVEDLFRWLQSPFPATRDVARSLLRERTDPRFLAGIVRRLQVEDPTQRATEYPIYRHVHWELLPEVELRALEPVTLLRIAGYLQASHGTPQQRVSHLGKLLRVAEGETCLKLLELLREYDVEPILEQLEPFLKMDDEQVQHMATSLIPARAARAAFIQLVGQLVSPYDTVRELAQRKISGHSLGFLLDSFDSLSSEERRRILPVLRKVDLHFTGQLRRALKDSSEATVVKALRTVVEADEVNAVEDTLLDLTVSPRPRIRATLARTLGHAHREAGLHYLRLFLADPDPRVVANAVETLGEMGDDGCRGWLDELRRHPSARVRTNTLLALGRLGDPTVRGELEGLASAAPSQDLRASASWALAALDGGP